MTQAEAYCAGWQACFEGEDGRFTNPFLSGSKASYAWDHGFLDAMEAEEGEEPEPETAGYGQ